MALTFQSIMFDAETPDRVGTLVFRDGRLLAVLACLSDIHGDLTGHWHVETVFGDVPERRPHSFASLADLEAWLGYFR